MSNQNLPISVRIFKLLIAPALLWIHICGLFCGVIVGEETARDDVQGREG